MPSRKSTAARMSSPTRAAGRVLLLASLGLLTGCGSTLVATVKPLCDVLEDTCVSKDDRLTEGTASKIEGDNLTLRATCQRKPQCPAPIGKWKTTVKPARVS